MKHKPTAGVIPPRSAVRVLYDPPLEPDEHAMLFTASLTGSIVLEESAAAVMLSNTTDKHTPFLLIVVSQNPPSIGAIFDFIKQRLGG